MTYACTHKHLEQGGEYAWKLPLLAGSCRSALWPEDTSTQRRTTYETAPNTERELSRQEAHEATARLPSHVVTAGANGQPRQGTQSNTSCQWAASHGAWAVEAPRRSSEAQGHKDKGGRGTRPAKAPRRSSEAQGHKDKREVEQVQPKRHEGAARLRGTRTRGKGPRRSSEAQRAEVPEVEGARLDSGGTSCGRGRWTGR